MFYLILAIICSSSIALIFKYSEDNSLNRYVVTSVNYFTAFLISFIFIMKANIKMFNFKNHELFTPQASQVWATIVGISAGFFFFFAFIYYQKSVKENGAGLAGTFGKLGILIPMLFSIILWQEYPSFIQWMGIVLAIFSIILVNFPFNRDWKEALRLNLILLFIFGGIAEFSNKVFQKYALVDYKVLFLFWVFFSAFLISLIFSMRVKNKPPTWREIRTGFLVGVPNLFSSFFLINALTQLKTAVVFPVFSAGSIVLINVAGFVIFKEKLNNREMMAVLMTTVALILINI